MKHIVQAGIFAFLVSTGIPAISSADDSYSCDELKVKIEELADRMLRCDEIIIGLEHPEKRRELPFYFFDRMEDDAWEIIARCRWTIKNIEPTLESLSKLYREECSK